MVEVTRLTIGIFYDNFVSILQTQNWRVLIFAVGSQVHVVIEG